MAANTADAITVTMARPPVRCLTSTPAAWTRRLESPPAVISSPASMNSGIASRLKDCEPATICCAKKAGSMSATSTTAMVARPMAMAKGTLIAASPTKVATSTIAVALMAGATLRPEAGTPATTRSTAKRQTSAPANGAMPCSSSMG